jgi:3-deoxy-D-manno-octulosonate 8-phosphate phosphatase (KDO 8-P phosphatase)
MSFSDHQHAQPSPEACLQLARVTLRQEADELHAIADRLNDVFGHAVSRILQCKGRVVVTGMGKSGHVGGKIASTLASTGTPAFFVAPHDISHGDLGMISQGDIVLALSNSGESPEVLALVTPLKRLNAFIIAITGNNASSLAKAADIHLSAQVSQEACPLGLAPTSSTTAALALGDALAVCVLDQRELSAEQLAELHAGGPLVNRGQQAVQAAPMQKHLAIQTQLQAIKLLILDVDGVMTDGDLTLGDDGQEYKTFHAHDGLGMKLLKASGVELAIITGRTSEVVKKRALSTGVAHFYQGAEDKLLAFQSLIAASGLSPSQCAFMGDDVVDLPAMLQCGVAFAVPNATDLVLAHAHYVTRKQGGHGAVREVCELIMRAQGQFDQQMAAFLIQSKLPN